MYGRGKSDCLIVPAKPSNKALCGCGDGGGKGAARGERGQHNTLRTQSRVRCVKCAGPCASVRAWCEPVLDPSEEPSAVVPHAGIRAGGRPKGRSLPRPSTIREGVGEALTGV